MGHDNGFESLLLERNQNQQLFATYSKPVMSTNYKLIIEIKHET